MRIHNYRERTRADWWGTGEDKEDKEVEEVTDMFADLAKKVGIPLTRHIGQITNSHTEEEEVEQEGRGRGR